jgi:serine/threonine protein kinase
MNGEVTAFDPHASLVGSTVGPWLILERLDSGSFGIVYRARRASHPDSPPVVVKMAKRPKDMRFEREVELLQHSPHPSIPRFEDAGEWTAPDGQRYPYVVMELVEGFTLYNWFRARQRTSRDVMRVLAQVAGALAAAHARDAVHRDVKGDNIRVTSEGRAVLVDWGSGWFAGARPLTDTTAPPGTGAYRPPEQRFFAWTFRKDVEARWHSQPTDDLYSLGVAFYRLVTGLYLPSQSEGDEVAPTREVPPSSDYATLSRDLEALILRLLANEREQRGTAEAMAQEAAALAMAAGEAADMPILPATSAEGTDKGFSFSEGSEDEEALSDTDGATSTTSSRTTEEERRPRRELQLPPGLSVVGVAVVGCLLIFLGWEMHRTASQLQAAPQPWIATHEEMAQFAPDAGVGEEALSKVQEVPRAAPPSLLSFGRSMPPKPLPGQRQPPCKRGEREINGGCWRGPIGEEKPPCGDEMFDYEGRCYIATGETPRLPTSEEP